MSQANSATTPTGAPVKAGRSLPLAVAYSDLVTGFLALRAPRIPVSPDPHHLLNIADHLREIAAIVDRYIEAVGSEIKSNSNVCVDGSLFDRQLFGALDGNALFEIQRAAEAIAEDNGQFGVGA
jgi:hypothetical protein